MTDGARCVERRRLPLSAMVPNPDGAATTPPGVGRARPARHRTDRL